MTDDSSSVEKAGEEDASTDPPDATPVITGPRDQSREMTLNTHTLHLAHCYNGPAGSEPRREMRLLDNTHTPSTWRTTVREGGVVHHKVIAYNNQVLQ